MKCLYWIQLRVLIACLYDPGDFTFYRHLHEKKKSRVFKSAIHLLNELYFSTASQRIIIMNSAWSKIDNDVTAIITAWKRENLHLQTRFSSPPNNTNAMHKNMYLINEILLNETFSNTIRIKTAAMKMNTYRGWFCFKPRNRDIFWNLNSLLYE